MKLVFIYQPVEDLAEAVAFHRDVLHLEEAWRESDDTVSFWLPDRSAQLMICTDPKPVGPMYLVENVGDWVGDHPGITATVEQYEIPGGSVAGFGAPGGNTFYVFDQPDV